MTNRIQIEELNEKWVCDNLAGVTSEDKTWVFIQEPAFIGFGVVHKDGICFPPDVQPDWELTSDLRLFGGKGEWHVWRDWDGKHYARLQKLEDIKDDTSVTEYHVLWGTDFIEDTGDDHWNILFETRGTEIWIPLTKPVLRDSHLPLRLQLKQIIGYDPKTHLAGIVDAVLIGLVDKDKHPISPT